MPSDPDYPVLIEALRSALAMIEVHTTTEQAGVVLRSLIENLHAPGVPMPGASGYLAYLADCGWGEDRGD